MEGKHGARCYNQLEEKGAANRLTKILLMETAEEDEVYEEMQALKEYILNRCYCGCEQNAICSEHLCLHSCIRILMDLYRVLYMEHMK